MDANGLTLERFLEEWNDSGAHVLVRTSGSTGKPKDLRVEKTRMMESARVTCRFLKLTPNDTALLCMPLDYIAGKMMVVRSLVVGMRLISVKPSLHPLKGMRKSPTFAAMVPAQVYGCMQDEQELGILKGIKNLIIGGGAIDAKMAERLRNFPNAVWSTYGMTETLSHIALRRLSGEMASEYYTPFDNVDVSLDERSCLCINAPQICSERLVTNDIAEFCKEDGRLFRIIGRVDNVIDSGGIKIHMEEVEDMLRGVLNVDFAITKQPDEKYGEIVVVLLERQAEMNISAIKQNIKSILPKYWIPKSFYLCDKIPHTPTGKIARMEVYDMVSTLAPV